MNEERDCTRFQDWLLAAAVAGRPDAGPDAGPDATAAADHLAGCPACRRELAQWRLVADATRLASQRLPEPAPEVLAGLWHRLDRHQIDRHQIDWHQSDAAPQPPLARRRPVPGWLRHAGALLANQMPLVGRRLFAASAVVMAVGTALALGAQTPNAAAGVLAVLAPVLAAVGLALVYGPEVDPGLELTLATPTSPRSVLLARMTLVFGYHLGLALAVNLVLVLARPNLAWWWLVSQWLGPMLLLASLALLVSVTLGPGSAITVALSLWTVRLVTLTEPGRALLGGPVRAVVDTVWSTMVPTLTIAAALLVAALLAVGRHRRLA